jgi:hypothetical protein
MPVEVICISRGSSCLNSVSLSALPETQLVILGPPDSRGYYSRRSRKEITPENFSIDAIKGALKHLELWLIPEDDAVIQVLSLRDKRNHRTAVLGGALLSSAIPLCCVETKASKLPQWKSSQRLSMAYICQ